MKEHIASKTAIEWSRKNNPPLMDPWETDLLTKYVKKCKSHFVEIGTHKGGAAALISNCISSKAKLTTIDIFEKPPKGSLPPPDKPPSYDEARQTIEKEGNISKVEIVKGVSWKVAEKWGGKVDVLFIDGDHRYAAIKKDFDSWKHHVLNGGYILIHDTDFPDVAKVVKEILKCPKYSLIEKSGTLIVIKSQ